MTVTETVWSLCAAGGLFLVALAAACVVAAIVDALTGATD